MKLFSKFSTALIALGFGLTARATDTIFYITGSTAYRAQTHQAILDYFNGGTAASTQMPTGGKWGYTNSSASGFGGSNAITFVGPSISGNRIIVKTSWSGSEAGVQAVTNPGTVNVNFITATYDSAGDSTFTQAGTASIADPTATGASPSAIDAEPADACMADTYQVSSRFTSPTLTDCNCAGGSASPVGVIPFIFVASKGSPLTNITPNLAQSLWKSTGITSLQMFTGNTSDASTRVYALGRDIDSGTRANMFAETGVGIFSTVKQWRPNVVSGAITAFPASAAYTCGITSGSATVTCTTAGPALGMTVTGTGIPSGSIITAVTPGTSFVIGLNTGLTTAATATNASASLTIAPNATLGQTSGTTGATTSKYFGKYPVQVINGISTSFVGNSGEHSGGTLAGYFGATASATTGYGVSMLGTSDSNTAAKAGAVLLTYNGQSIWSTYSTSGITFNFTPILNGNYTMWGYEHLFYNASTISAGKQTVADAIGTQLYTTDAQVQIPSMTVSRSGDGTSVVPNFSF